MKRYDAEEATDIIERTLAVLLKAVPASGRPGSDARTTIGYVQANTLALLMGDVMGEPLTACFQETFEAGCVLTAIDAVRRQVETEKPYTLGARLVTNSCMQLCLSIIGRIIASMTFVSRQDVEALKRGLMQPFADAEETAADSMDSAAFQALVELHAAITNHLVSTALPLPRMLKYQFYEPLPSLVLAYRLYGDAGRADEVRKENKIVHPAFCPPLGEALSA
jgi:hypothetical protein